MAGPARSAGAGGAGGEGYTADIRDQPCRVQALGADIEIAVIAFVGAAVDRPAAQLRSRAIPEMYDMGRILVAPFPGERRCGTEAGAERRAEGSRADAGLLRAAMHEWFERNPLP